jgi:gamma-glutamylcyclotransferase (GGCT)/AIG2-like uncharacterized protein YtfP
MTKHYFAYGSNMNEKQMASRCPGCKLIGRARLKGYSFLINERGVASVTVAPKRIVHGLLWTITDADEKALDRYEGVGRKLYAKSTVTVGSEADGANIDALLYIGSDNSPGSPRPSYLEKIIGAARAHNLPTEYVAELESWHR